MRDLIRWKEIKGCPAKLLPDEGQLIAAYNGRDAWLSRWKTILGDQRLKGHVTHFADASELSLPYPPAESKAAIDEDRARTAMRDLKRYHKEK